jgi:hypothetical protein
MAIMTNPDMGIMTTTMVGIMVMLIDIMVIEIGDSWVKESKAIREGSYLNG